MNTPDPTTWGTGKPFELGDRPNTPLRRSQQAAAIQNLRNTHTIDPDYQPTNAERLDTLTGRLDQPEHQLNQIDRNLKSLIQGLQTITNILNPQ